MALCAGGTLSRAWPGQGKPRRGRLGAGVGEARSPASSREGVPPRVCHLCLWFSSSSARSRFVSVFCARLPPDLARFFCAVSSSLIVEIRRRRRRQVFSLRPLSAEHSHRVGITRKNLGITSTVEDPWTLIPLPIGQPVSQ